MYKTIPITDLTEKQRRSFSCGVAPLDDYFRQFAKGNHVKNIGKTFVLLGDSSDIIGYYTTSMGSVDFHSLPDTFRSKLPRYPIPIARIGRLAVDVKKQGNGWGEFLLVDTFHRIRDATSLVAAFGADNNLCLFYQ